MPSGNDTYFVGGLQPESPAQVKQALDRTLRESHRIRVLVRIYNTDDIAAKGKLIEGKVIEGQVDCDLDAEVTRSLTLTIMDPEGSFVFDAMGKVYADDFIGVEYGVWVPELEDWVDTPVFFGPVSRYERNGPEVTLEAQGKESLMLPPTKQVLPDLTPANRYLRTVLREIFDAFGEEKYRLGAARSKTIPGSFSIDAAKARELGSWRYAQKLAASRNLLLLYGGDGYLEAKKLNPSQPTYVFRDALTEPVLGYSMDDIRNRVEVWDQDTKGKPDPLVRLDLPASHPLSKESLARNGKHRILVERVELDSVKTTVAEATNIAEGVLRSHSHGIQDVAFDHLVVPHLKLGDRMALRLKDKREELFTLRRFSIPLTAADSMAVGYTRPLRVARGKFKYRRRILK